MTTRVIPDPDGIDQLLNEPAVLALVAKGAQDVAANARAIAPLGREGFLKRSYRATPARVSADGVTATAYTISMAGHWAEWGSVNNPPYAPLRRGAERLGFRTRLAPKGRT